MEGSRVDIPHSLEHVGLRFAEMDKQVRPDLCVVEVRLELDGHSLINSKGLAIY